MDDQRSDLAPTAPPPSRTRTARTARLGRVAAGGAMRWVGDRVDVRGTPEERRRRRGDRVVATVDALVDQLSVLRGAAMKAGQVLSTVDFPGLEPDQAAYVRERLSSLRSSAPGVGWKEMRKLLAREWGEAPERVLAEIDPDPVAAASIGQVYRGRTEDGRLVAVKVQYPGIAETIEADMRNVSLLSPLLRQLMPGLDVKGLLLELRERILEECDYELEASNHRRIERFWRGHPFVLVPAVDTELSRRRVLVTDWVDGIPFEEVLAAPEATRDRYAQIIYRFFYTTATELGLALGDPHPGNYLLCPDGRVAFFDFGMLRPLPPEYVRREGAIAAHLRRGDIEAVRAGMHELGYLPGEPTDWDGELLAEYMRRVSWWLDTDTPLRLTPEDLWRAADVLRDERGAEHVAQLRQMTLPAEALLLRRMEGLLFQMASTLRAAAPWGPLLRELTAGAELFDELGAAHAGWRAGVRGADRGHERRARSAAGS
jgi:predicted unusual protein kinase regulating ubiquinone biosynthesis (AarF/ABC1/UbiB family)